MKLGERRVIGTPRVGEPLRWLRVDALVSCTDGMLVLSQPAPSSSQSRRAAGSRKGVAPSAPPLPNLSLDDRSDLEDPKTQLAQHRDLFVGGADCTCGAPLSLVKHNVSSVTL